MTRRVVITGVGLVTPIGIGPDEVWASLRQPRSAVATITRFDPSPFRSRIAAAIPDFDPVERLTARQARRSDRCSQLGLAAAQLALADSHLDLAELAPDRVGVLMGTALGGVGFAEQENEKYLRGGARDVDPLLALTVFGGALSCNIAIAHGISGVNATNAMSCASGTLAIGDAFRAVARGEADVMLAGGSEAPLYPLCYGAFSLIRAMSTRNDDPGTASRPFDRGRDGFVMGEGAAVLVIESRDRAVARGAPIYAEIAGFGLTNDAFHMTQPRSDGREAIRAMRNALTEAHCAPHEVEWVYAHGSSTPLNDDTEALAARRGARGASRPGAGERHQGVARPRAGRHRRHRDGDRGPGDDPRLDPADAQLRRPRSRAGPAACSRGRPRPATPATILKNSFGFGGCNATLVLRDGSM